MGTMVYTNTYNNGFHIKNRRDVLLVCIHWYQCKQHTKNAPPCFGCSFNKRQA